MKLKFNKTYDLENIYKCSLIENPVVIRKVIAPKYRWKTYELVFDVHVKLSNEMNITIPEGFLWDLSSVPRILWSLLPPDGDFIIAALIHDWLYVERKTVLQWFKGNHTRARKFADKEMLLWSKVMHSGGAFNFRTIDNYLRFFGVRIFGGFVWYSKKAKVKQMNQHLITQ